MSTYGTLVSHGSLPLPSSPPIVFVDHANEDVASIFKRFDNISEPKKLGTRKDKSKSKSVIADKRGLHTEVAAEITTVLRRLQAILRGKRWSLAALFYERMVCSQKILSESQVLHYQQILLLYLEVLDAVPSEVRQSMGDFAQQLLLYLQTHAVDPDSALIGLSPADDVIHKLAENSDFVDYCKLSKEELVKQIVRWSQLSEAEAIMLGVRVCAASFRGVDKLRRGDVAIVRLTNGKFVFGRFAGERTENTATFYVDPLEVSVAFIDVWDVWPITKSITDGMKEVKGMEKLIRQAVEAFFASLHQEVKALTLNSLSAMGINVAVTERATELKMTLSDVDDLKFITTKLAEVYADTSTSVFKQCEEFIYSKVTEYINQLDPKTMFMPKYNATMQVLREYPKIPLARSRVRQLLGTCELALDQLKTSMRKILNGDLKAQITEWWLKKIETKVNAFLQAHGYEFTAVPDNYIEQPPESLEAVRANLAIVTKTLDPLAIESSPRSLIKELRDEIYPVIDDFMRSSIIALCDYLELESKPLLNPTANTNGSFGFNAAPAIPILKVALEKRLATATAAHSSSSFDHSPLSANMVLLFEQLGDMIRDLEYLASMKALEDNPNPAEKSLHIVPVGGLVIGSFLRLENELKTVIELWDVQDEVDNTEAESKMKRNRADSEKVRKVSIDTYETEGDTNAADFESDEATELQWAVCSGDLENVREALASQQIRSTISTPDPHGWTPLHMASVLGNWEICELLLEVEGVDVTATNEKGGVALHYVVKHPHSPSQMMLVQKLLDLHPALITAKNRYSETPLHAACLKADQNVVAQLVGYKQIEINSRTVGGETPLHYAVTVGSDAMVAILLKAGADPTIEAKRGTPLDLALGYKHLGIATVLRKALGMTNDHGWPRTTRTPGQHTHSSSSRASLDTDPLHGGTSGAYATDHAHPHAHSHPHSHSHSDALGALTAADPSSSEARHIKIGIRQPRRGSIRNRSRLPDKPVFLGSNEDPQSTLSLTDHFSTSSSSGSGGSGGGGSGSGGDPHVDINTSALASDESSTVDEGEGEGGSISSSTSITSANHTTNALSTNPSNELHPTDPVICVPVNSSSISPDLTVSVSSDADHTSALLTNTSSISAPTQGPATIVYAPVTVAPTSPTELTLSSLSGANSPTKATASILPRSHSSSSASITTETPTSTESPTSTETPTSPEPPSGTEPPTSTESSSAEIPASTETPTSVETPVTETPHDTLHNLSQHPNTTASQYSSLATTLDCPSLATLIVEKSYSSDQNSTSNQNPPSDQNPLSDQHPPSHQNSSSEQDPNACLTSPTTELISGTSEHDGPNHPSWNSGSVVGSFSRSVPTASTGPPTLGNTLPSSGSPKSPSQTNQRWVPERTPSSYNPSHPQPPQPLFQLPQSSPALLLQHQPPQSPPQDLAESPTNWHAARIRRGDSSAKRNMVALRTHNKTLSDGNLSFLTNKIQSELQQSSRNTSYRASSGNESNNYPITKGFDTNSSHVEPTLTTTATTTTVTNTNTITTTTTSTTATTKRKASSSTALSPLHEP